jgi:hypothetical protein
VIKDAECYFHTSSISVQDSRKENIVAANERQLMNKNVSNDSMKKKNSNTISDKRRKGKVLYSNSMIE